MTSSSALGHINWHMRNQQSLAIYLAGGRCIDVVINASNMEEVAERLRRERVLIGQMSFTDEEGDHVRDVLIPSNRIDFVVDADG